MLATVKLTRVVELLLMARAAEVLLVGDTLRSGKRRIAGLLRLQSSLLLLACAQNRRDGARLLLISAVEVVVPLTQRLLLREQFVFARVLLTDRQEVAIHLLALRERALEL